MAENFTQPTQSLKCQFTSFNDPALPCSAKISYGRASHPETSYLVGAFLIGMCAVLEKRSRAILRFRPCWSRFGTWVTLSCFRIDTDRLVVL